MKEGFVSGTCEMRKRPVDEDDDENERFAVPDIITHEPGARMGFYEIKANSQPGKVAGRVKIDAFLAMVDFLRKTDPGIRYSKGTQFDPDRSILIWDGTWFGSPIKAFLHFFREDEALIVYEICIEISGQLLAEVLIKVIIKLAVIAVILLLAPAAGGVGVLAWTSPMDDSVGPDGTNEGQDVRYLQALLGEWRSHTNGSLIAIDGELTDETTRAVTECQRSVGLDDTGGNVSPGDVTVTALEQTHLENAAASVMFADMQELGMEGLADIVFAEKPDGVDPEVDDEPNVVVALSGEFESYLQDLHNSV